MSKAKKKAATKKKKTKTVKCTHGCCAKYVGKDEIKRQLSFFRFADNTYQIEFVTYWDGEDKEPLTTKLLLEAESFGNLVTGMMNFATNRDTYKNK